MVRGVAFVVMSIESKSDDERASGEAVGIVVADVDVNVDVDGFHCCNKGGKHMRKDTIQTAATIVLALGGVIIERYFTGLVTATYLSTLIAHRFKIDAVEIQTSVTSQPRHQILPKIQTSSI